MIDFICDMIIDMVCLSKKNTFKNLYDSLEIQHKQAHTNLFF